MSSDFTVFLTLECTLHVFFHKCSQNSQPASANSQNSSSLTTTQSHADLQIHSCAVPCKRKKRKKNTAESKNEKKIAEEQVIFSSYKADSFQRL